MNASAIFIQTHTNESPRWISKYHLAQPIVVFTDNQLILHQLDGYYRGCHSVFIEKEMNHQELLQIALQQGFEFKGGKVLVVNHWSSKLVVDEISI